MRHFNPADEFHKHAVEEAEHLGAKPWQLDLLSVNPGYCGFENYDHEYGSWNAFGPWRIDDLNELVHFYFEIDRAKEECPDCGGDGYHPDARPVVRTFYQHSCHRGEVEWCDKITQDELEALIERGRIKEGTPLDKVNAANRRVRGGFGLTHDAINRHILIEQRLKRLGLPKTCPLCDGHGHVFTAPEPHINLAVWIIQPRRESSHKIIVRNITQEELPTIRDYLADAANRNTDRFARIEKIGG